MLPGEGWWGIANNMGSRMPFTEKTLGFAHDLNLNNHYGSIVSLLISDRGRVIWCAEQTKVGIDAGTITMESASAPVTVKEAGRTLRDAYLFASANWFPPSGRIPDPLFFSAPQLNTWMELTYNQNEKDILAYADSMLANGVPPGVLMIDDTWQFNYGVWDFDPRRFRDPKGMCDRLHAKGYKVVLWVCPFVSLDSQSYRDLTGHGRARPGKGGFVLDATGKPAHERWWNGYSALLDLTDPKGDRWFRDQLDRLKRDYGVDGFKFDAGNVMYYSHPGHRVYKEDATSGDQCYAYSILGEDYPTSEHRLVWKMSGRPVMVRLPDKANTWEDVRLLIPDMLAAGLLGYPFVCPDMIGGGLWAAYLPGSKTPYNRELFIRCAQVHALCPMMQFSISPWRLMKDDPEGMGIIRDTVALRQRFAPKILALAEESGRTGEPIMRSLEYEFPGCGYADIKDEFMMGKDLLVAPVLEEGVTSRKVAIPSGTWLADDGTEVTGPRTIVVETPLSRLPHFQRKKP